MYVMGEVNGSHIPIIASPADPTSYYYRKGFSLALLQGVVEYTCKFWDYIFGWIG